MKTYILLGILAWLLILFLMVRMMQALNREMREADSKVLCEKRESSK